MSRPPQAAYDGKFTTDYTAVAFNTNAYPLDFRFTLITQCGSLVGSEVQHGVPEPRPGEFSAISGLSEARLA